MATQVFGRWGENQAANFLKRKGFKIVDRNFRTSRGEIDIIAQKGDDYYFIEVKTRVVGAMATDEAITPFKKLKFANTLRTYLVKKDLSDVGVITAGLLVSANKVSKRVQFRMAVFIN